MDSHSSQSGGLARLRSLFREADSPLRRPFRNAWGGLLTDQRRCLIVGAGDAGEAFLRELHRSSSGREYDVVGFLDDDPSKHGVLIHGAPVLGSTEEVRAICERERVEELLFAIKNLPPSRLRRIVQRMHGMSMRFRMVLSMKAVLEEGVVISWDHRTSLDPYVSPIDRWLRAIDAQATVSMGRVCG
jgi:FlaA1/EpsC-like NDP-sugar epimerase